MYGLEIHEGAFGHVSLVCLEIRDGLGIGRPPVADVATPKDFLPIDPGERAIQKLVGTVRGAAGFFLCGDVEEVEVVGAHEGKKMAVWRKFHIFFFGGRVGDAKKAGRRKIEKKNIAVEKKHGLAAGGVESLRPR